MSKKKEIDWTDYCSDPYYNNVNKQFNELHLRRLKTWINPPWYTKLWRWVRLAYWRIYWKLFMPSNVYINIGGGFIELIIEKEEAEAFSYRYLDSLSEGELRKIIKELA